MTRDVTTPDSGGGDVAVVIPAAGLGLRLGGGTPKALREINGESILRRAVRTAAAAPSVALVAVAAPADRVEEVVALVAGVSGARIRVVAGGASRQSSVAAALAAVVEALPIVLVHDAARALAPASLFERVAAAVRDGAEAVVPVLPVADTIKRVSTPDRVAGTVDRAELRRVQTPQGFAASLLRTLHAGAGAELTDDAGLVEAAGGAVRCVPGDELAFKVTTPFDLRIAQALAGGTTHPTTGPPAE
ncbi:2-C-methyl-D-erythritol 4-phosphate cytidylyltransferase [Pilimelia columellifera]|uniref:2-C-methyl-D-erythritol 4-phosphate cytidylyltransferase n=1 Tax=Pilimelia columellifera subsp. columellifera TaxID=706583 RepID=A0ABN3NEB6_9ACTN